MAAEMPKLWFSYSLRPDLTLDSPEPPNSPYTITWNLGRFLRDKAASIGYEFVYRNLDSADQDTIGPDDIILGHTWYPTGWINRALDSASRAKFVLQPYSAGMVAETERPWIKDLFAKADHLFLVTGPAWWACMETSGYGEWKGKATRLDMAVNPTLHPHLKTRWNSPGKRGFLAIGADIPAKGIDLVADLARMGGMRTGYFGQAAPGRFAHVPQIVEHGGADFTPDLIAYLCRHYDFFVSLARADANPTTLLETSAWGLVAACNRESGYLPDEPFVELRLDDVCFNLDQVERLQMMSDYDLRQRAECVRRLVVERHSWARFCETVWNEVIRWL